MLFKKVNSVRNKKRNSIKNMNPKIPAIGNKAEWLSCNSASFIFNIIKTKRNKTAIAPT
jgi:hypothetical protein